MTSHIDSTLRLLVRGWERELPRLDCLLRCLCVKRWKLSATTTQFLEDNARVMKGLRNKAGLGVSAPGLLLVFLTLCSLHQTIVAQPTLLVSLLFSEGVRWRTCHECCADSCAVRRGCQPYWPIQRMERRGQWWVLWAVRAVPTTLSKVRGRAACRCVWSTAIKGCLQLDGSVMHRVIIQAGNPTMYGDG